MTSKASAARAWASAAIHAIHNEKKTLEECLAQNGGFTALSVRDRAFARAVVGAVLRHNGQIEFVLAHFLDSPLRPRAASLKALMHCAIGEILFLRTPGFAVVNDYVSLSAADPAMRGYKGLVNAVLRKVTQSGADVAQTCPVTHNIPPWLRKRWARTYGEDSVHNAAMVLQEDPPTDLAIIDGDAEAWAQRLGGQVLGGKMIRVARSAARSGDVSTWPGYEEGCWFVQDGAASLPVFLLAPQKGEAILDLCAAPGGKTMQMARAGATVWALDRSKRRLKRLEENLARLHLDATCVVGDALQWAGAQKFDAVLLDAPCSATGIFRRHPDVLMRKSDKQIARLATQQLAMIKAAITHVKPGGRLVYCVCSAERKEGEGVIERAVQSLPVRIDSKAGQGLPFGLEFLKDGMLRIPPGAWADKNGLDAFFATCLRLQS